MVKVSIVILNWKGLADTKVLLKNIDKLKLGKLSVETIVVDNGSPASEIKFFKNYKTKNTEYFFIGNKNNLGFAGGNNVGIRLAQQNGADYVLILNNDVELSPNFLTELLEGVQKNNIGAVSPKIYFAKGFEFHRERYSKSELGRVLWYAGGIIDWDNIYGQTRGVDEVDIGQYQNTVSTDFATGTCMLIPSAVLKKVGMFDEKYFLYYEDTDLSVRIEKAGYKVHYIPSSVIWHKVAQSSGIGSELNDYYTTRNRMLFGLKYAKVRTKIALIRESVRLLFMGRKWQKIGIRDFYLMRFGKGSWK